MRYVTLDLLIESFSYSAIQHCKIAVNRHKTVIAVKVPVFVLMTSGLGFRLFVREDSTGADVTHLEVGVVGTLDGYALGD